MFEKLLENALAQYLPNLTKMTEAKKAQLVEIRARVRSHPEEVEAWFDKEIEKLKDENVKDLIRNIEKGPSITSLGTENSE